MLKIYPALLLSLLLAGCNNYVENVSLTELKKLTGMAPKEILDASFAITENDKKAVNISRDSITFSDGSYLTKNGEGRVRFPKGYRFITESLEYILAVKDSGKFVVVDDKANLIHKDRLPYPIVSAKIAGNRIFYIALNNIFGMYDLEQKRNILAVKVGKAYAVDTRICNPIKIQNLLVVPTLDGKLLVTNPANPTGASGMSIGKSLNLNNVIFLSHIGNRIIASTPSKIISASPGAMHKYKTPVADVATSGNRVYLLARDGRIIIFTPDLKIIKSKRFKYQKFSTIAVLGNSIFALDADGYLLVTDQNLVTQKVYDVGDVDNYTFVSGNKLYKDDEIINLNRLKL
jgi:hypothetical protein